MLHDKQRLAMDLHLRQKDDTNEHGLCPASRNDDFASDIDLHNDDFATTLACPWESNVKAPVVLKFKCY